MDYVFEWDPNKARRNKKQHGISFEQAVMVFKDPKAISMYDTEHSKGEDRWITLGLSINHGLYQFNLINALFESFRVQQSGVEKSVF